MKTTNPLLVAIATVLLASFGFLLSGQKVQEENPQPQTKSNVPLILLYDEIPDINQRGKIESLQLGVWMNVGQDVQSYKTGVISIGSLIQDIDRRTGRRPPTWMMLDAEDPFFADLQKDKDSPEFIRATNSIISTIRLLKLQYPGTKWSLYGAPNLPYWVNKKGWATATDDERKLVLTQAAAAYSPIIAELDWVSVSIYSVYDPNMVIYGSPKSIGGTPESVRKDGRAWRRASVGLAQLLAQGKPVLPMIYPYWSPGGVAPYCRVINPRQFIEDQIAPAIQAGANGFALWCSINYRISQSTKFEKDPSIQPQETNCGVAEWRTAFTADYFNGKSPVDWSDPEVVQTLIRKTSQTIVDSLFNIRVFEKSGALPQSSP